jgi:hypothetical protein
MPLMIKVVLMLYLATGNIITNVSMGSLGSKIYVVGFEVFTAVTMKNGVFVTSQKTTFFKIYVVLQISTHHHNL